MERPNYYAVIPAEVRYAKIPDGAKLLYGEITALSSKEGYCWASNAYFAELYGVGVNTISSWVNILKENQFVYVDLLQNSLRKIYIDPSKKLDTPSRKIVNPPHEKLDTSIKYNNTLNTGVAFAPHLEIVEVKDSETEKKPKKGKYEHAREVFTWFPKPQKAWEINTTELQHAELLFERGEKQVRLALAVVAENSDNPYCPVITKPSHLEQKWSNLFRFAHKQGLI